MAQQLTMGQSTPGTFSRRINLRRPLRLLLSCLSVSCVCSSRLLDQNTNLPVVPPASPASFGAPFLEKRGGGVSPTFVNTPKQPQGGNARGIFVGSPVHSPGWPSPRGGVGGFTPRWSPGEPMKCSSAAGGAFATMPPTPPQISSRTVGGCAGLRPQSSATVEVAGVAWLGSETTASTDPPDAAAVAGDKNSSQELVRVVLNGPDWCRILNPPISPLRSQFV